MSVTWSDKQSAPFSKLDVDRRAYEMAKALGGDLKFVLERAQQFKDTLLKQQGKQ